MPMTEFERISFENKLSFARQRVANLMKTLEYVKTEAGREAFQRDLDQAQCEFLKCLNALGRCEPEKYTLGKVSVPRSCEPLPGIQKISGFLSEKSPSPRRAEVPVPTEKETILFLFACPSQNLRLPEEAREIREEIQKTRWRDFIHLETRWATRAKDFSQNINETMPAIVHFSGHGNEDLLQVHSDKTVSGSIITADALELIFKSVPDGTVKVLFLDACYTQSLAERLAQHVDAVIGMRFPIMDDTATILAKAFYSAIGYGLSVQTAFEQGVAAIEAEGKFIPMEREDFEESTTPPLTPEILKEHPDWFLELEGETPDGKHVNRVFYRECATPVLCVREGVDASKLFIMTPFRS